MAPKAGDKLYGRQWCDCLIQRGGEGRREWNGVRGPGALR